MQGTSHDSFPVSQALLQQALLPCSHVNITVSGVQNDIADINTIVSDGNLNQSKRSEGARSRH